MLGSVFVTLLIDIDTTGSLLQAIISPVDRMGGLFGMVRVCAQPTTVLIQGGVRPVLTRVAHLSRVVNLLTRLVRRANLAMVVHRSCCLFHLVVIVGWIVGL